MPKAKSKYKYKIFISLLVVILLVVGGLIYWNNHHKSTKVVSVKTISATDVPMSAKKTSKIVTGTTSTTTTSKTSDSTTVATSTSGSPTPPSGSFVSNHGQSSQNLVYENTSEYSICNVRPNATCVITFTMGNQVISLNTQTAGNGGSVAWSWTPQQVGLSNGTWQVKAASTLGTSSSSSSTEDPTSLVVQ